MAISRSNMAQEIRLAPEKRVKGIKNSIISKAKGDLSGFDRPNYKARAVRPGGYAGGGLAKANHTQPSSASGRIGNGKGRKG